MIFNRILGKDFLELVANTLNGGYVDGSQEAQLNLYWKNYKGSFRQPHDNHPKAVVGFYYQVNSVKVPAFIYFVDFVDRSSSGSSNTHLPCTIVEIPLEQTSLNLFIKSKINLNLYKQVDAGEHNGQLLNIESDFGQYFRVFHNDNSGQNIEALKMLEPNLMLAILKNFGNVSLEIKKNKLFIIIPKFVKNLNDIIRLINNTKMVTDQINFNIKDIHSGGDHYAESGANYKSISSSNNRAGLKILLVISIGAFVIGWAFIIYVDRLSISENAKIALFTGGVFGSAIGFVLLIKIRMFKLKLKYIKNYGRNGIY